MAGEGADRIQIPVGLSIDDANKVASQIRQVFEKALSDIVVTFKPGALTNALPSVVGTKTFTSGGKEFEARSKIKLTGMPTFKEGESGELDVASVSQLVTNIREIKKKVNKELSSEAKRFENFKRSIQNLPPEARKTNIENFLNEFSNIQKFIDQKLPVWLQLDELKSIASKVKSFDPGARKQFKVELRELEKSIKGLSFDEQTQKIQDFVKRFGDQNNELKSKLDRATKAVEGKQFRKIKVENIGKPIDEQIKAYQKIIDQQGQFADNAMLEIERLKAQAVRDAAIASTKANANKRAFKSKLSTMPISDRFAEIQKAIDDKLLTLEEGKALLARESKRFVDSIKGSRKQKFQDFAKRLQTMDPNLAIKELDNYINAGTSAFVNDAKILRDRLRKQVQNAQAQAQQSRNRNFANLALASAGAGLGLLGPAGFPLLNVGFAAMSGGVPAAIIVGFTTALGEAVRAIGEFRDSTVESARNIGLVGTGLKLAEARDKGLRAFIGTGSLAAERAALEREMQAFKESGGSIREFNKRFDNLSNAAEARFKRGLLDPRGEGVVPGPGQGFFPQEALRQQIVKFFREFGAQKELTEKFDPEELISARRNFLAQMNRPTVGIETDPLQTWRRIQNSFLDPSKSLEEKERREMTRMVLQQIEALQENTEAIKNNRPASSGVSGTW